MYFSQCSRIYSYTKIFSCCIAAVKERIYMLRLIRDMISRFFDHEVSRSGVVLAYFLLFSIFPMLITLNVLLSAADLTDAIFSNTIKALFPDEIFFLITSYLEYISTIEGPAIFITGVFLTLFSFSRAVNALIFAVNRAYDTQGHISRRRAFLRSVAVTGVLAATFIATLLILILGRGILSELMLYSGQWLKYFEIWNAARFFVLGVFIFGALSLIYFLLPANRPPWHTIIPGTAFALVCWMAMTAAFSYYVSEIADYSRIYGSLGVVIMLMFWLYLTSAVLILGGELNASLAKRRAKQQER
ncbi:MAG: YihY/virulence factor BrkB family protein [Ruminococcaceae bacterium]|nr:YihY/virulence factor BrkB family protein [Oscillospiraceae bacterium]